MTDPTTAYIEIKEGRKAYLYDDANGHRIVPGYTVIGHPTIGVGTALDVDGLQNDEIDLIRDNRVKQATEDVALLLGDHFALAAPARQAALVSMRFQLGPNGFRGFHEMLDAIRLGDWSGAGAEGRQSKWYRQTTARAEEECTMLETGEWPAGISFTGGV